jgi:hypothetical protein
MPISAGGASLRAGTSTSIPRAPRGARYQQRSGNAALAAKSMSRLGAIMLRGYHRRRRIANAISVMKMASIMAYQWHLALWRRRKSGVIISAWPQ